MKKLLFNLNFQVITGIILGVAVGFCFPSFGPTAKIIRCSRRTDRKPICMRGKSRYGIISALRDHVWLFQDSGIPNQTNVRVAWKGIAAREKNSGSLV